MKSFLKRNYRALFIFSMLCFTCLIVGCGLPTWLADANSILPVAVQSILGILSLVAALSGKTLSASEVTTITNFGTSVQNAIKDIEAMVEDYQQQSSTTLLGEIEAAVTALQSQLTQFLTDVHVTDPSTQAKISAIVNLVLTQIEAWASIIPALKATATATVTPAGVAVTRVPEIVPLKVPLTKQAFKQAYNAVLNTPTGNADVDAACAGSKRL